MPWRGRPLCQPRREGGPPPPPPPPPCRRRRRRRRRNRSAGPASTGRETLPVPPCHTGRNTPRNGWAGEDRVRLDHYAVRSAPDALGRVEGRGVEALEAEVTDRITLAVHNASYQAVGGGGTGHEG